MHTALSTQPNQIDWFIGYTHPQCEVQSDQELFDAGYESYLPLGRKTVTIKTRYRRVKQEVLRPAFPRYIFVGVKPGQCVDSIRQIKGIADLLANNGTPLRVLSCKIEEFKARQNIGDFDEAKNRRLKADDMVVVQSGPFEGYSGKVRASPNGKTVLVDLDGRKVALPMDILMLLT